MQEDQSNVSEMIMIATTPLVLPPQRLRVVQAIQVVVEAQGMGLEVEVEVEEVVWGMWMEVEGYRWQHHRTGNRCNDSLVSSGGGGRLKE
jgi:hypothetical protein